MVDLLFECCCTGGFAFNTHGSAPAQSFLHVPYVFCVLPFKCMLSFLDIHDYVRYITPGSSDCHIRIYHLRMHAFTVIHSLKRGCVRFLCSALQT